MDNAMITISRNFAKILTDYVGRLQTHDFSEAAMAMAAAIIWADGHLHEVERAKLEEFITTSPLLQVGSSSSSRRRVRTGVGVPPSTGTLLRSRPGSEI